VPSMRHTTQPGVALHMPCCATATHALLCYLPTRWRRDVSRKIARMQVIRQFQQFALDVVADLG